MACTNYRPDQNGECLNCDEPADAHLPEGEPFDPVELGRIARWQYTENFVEAETRKPVLSLLVRFLDGGTLHVGGVMGEQLLLDVRPAPRDLVTGDARQQVKRGLLIENERARALLRRLHHYILPNQSGDPLLSTPYYEQDVALVQEALTAEAPALENPKLYDAARDACHNVGLPWTDPRTGVTHPPPRNKSLTTKTAIEALRAELADSALDELRRGVVERRERFKSADQIDNSLARAGVPMFYQCPLCLDPHGIEVPEAWVTRPEFCRPCSMFLEALSR